MSEKRRVELAEITNRGVLKGKAGVAGGKAADRTVREVERGVVVADEDVQWLRLEPSEDSGLFEDAFVDSAALFR